MSFSIENNYLNSTWMWDIKKYLIILTMLYMYSCTKFCLNTCGESEKIIIIKEDILNMKKFSYIEAIPYHSSRLLLNAHLLKSPYELESDEKIIGKFVDDSSSKVLLSTTEIERIRKFTVTPKKTPFTT